VLNSSSRANAGEDIPEVLHSYLIFEAF